MKAKIHAIGDSHTTLFSGKDEIIPNWPEPHEDLLPQFKTYRLGAMLAYNLAAERHEGREKLFQLLATLPKRSKVMLCFGEIDCRAHIVKQARLQDRTIKAVAEEVAEHYFQAVAEVETRFRVCVWGATPQNSASYSSNKFPTVGSMRERNQATYHFNEAVKMLCDNAEIPFANVWQPVVNKDLDSDAEYFFDTAHLSQKALPFALEALADFIA